MTWLQTDQTWGVPVVHLRVARRLLGVCEALSFLQSDPWGKVDPEKVAAWVTRMLHGQYPGVCLIALGWDYERDCLWMTVMHRGFPPTPPYAVLPEWSLVCHDAGDGTLAFTFEAPAVLATKG